MGSTPLPRTTPTNVRWLIVAMLTIIVALAQFNRVSMSVAGKQFIQQKMFSEEEMGLVYSTFLLIYTIGMVPGGWFIDRIGPRAAMTAMGLCFGFCVILTGALGWVGPAISSMLLPLLLIRGLAGAMSVPLHPGAARAVSLWLPTGQRSTANGTITAGALVGIALTYPVFGWLMDQTSWQTAFVLSGLALMILAMIWWTLSADNPTEHTWTNSAERELVAKSELSQPRVRTGFQDILRLFQNRRLVLLTLSYGAVNYLQYLFFYWIEYYFTKVHHQSDSESRQTAFLISMAMAFGMLSGGCVADWLCRKLGQTLGSRIMAVTGFGLAALFSLLGAFASDPQLSAFWFALSLGTLGLAEGIFWTTAPILEKRNGGLACALMNTGGNGIGMLGPIVTPILAARFGWEAGIVVGCIVCGIGGLLWLAIRSEASEFGPQNTTGSKKIILD
jgi:MFS family permease